MIRSNRPPGERQADDILDAYLAEQFGVGLEQVLLDGVHGTVSPAAAGIVSIDTKPVARWLHSDGGLTEHFEGTMTVQGVAYSFRCETWSMPEAYVHRFLTNLARFDPVEWSVVAKLSVEA